MSEVEVAFYSDACDCPDRSWCFPATADLILEAGVSAHWRDDLGWSPCVVNDLEDSIETPMDSGVVARRAVVEANKLPLEYWRSLWQRWLKTELSHAEYLLETAERIVVKERIRRRTAECHVVAARIEDPVVAVAAHRLLAQGWSGTPAELVTTASALAG